MPEPETTIGYEQFAAQLESLPARAPAALDADRGRAMAWLALAPAWPETLAVNGFPV
jgi:hypothetical protein